MRCPKCGYISFDYLERCKKCKKDISMVSLELKGSTYEMPTPLFLYAPRPVSSTPKKALAAQAAEDLESETEVEPDFTLEEGPTFEDDSLAGEALEPLEEQREITLDMAAFDNSAPAQESQAELELDISIDDLEESNEAPALALRKEIDFAGLDISDLKGPDAAPAAVTPTQTMPELVVERDAITPKPTLTTAATKKNAAQDFSLEDLQVSDLDLEAPTPLVASSAAGKKYLPATKTGTALDKFDIDLGDLLSSKEK